MSRKNLVAIGNSVVDFLHDPQHIEQITSDSDGKISADAFLSNLPSLLDEGLLDMAPRAGDAILITIEDLEIAANRYLQQSGITDVKNNFNGTPSIERILGRYEIDAGGSLANTVAALAHSNYYVGSMGAPLLKASYVSVSDEGPAGKSFADSMPHGVVTGSEYGQCLRVHVVPFQGDRIMIASPSKEKATDHYDISPHLESEISVDTDMVMFEGFLAFGQHFENIAAKTLELIETTNVERAAQSLPPIHLIITAASQPISNMDNYREFVRKAIQTTDVTVHANTGEFRRLLDDDLAWRNQYNEANNHPFEGLDGSELQNAKDNVDGYREAKTAANIHTIEEVAIPSSSQSQHNVRFVVTDGGNPAYVVSNDNYITHIPAALDKSQIVNKVGAGDAFMAGFWAGQLLGFDNEKSMQSAGIFAHAAIKQQGARLSPDLVHTVSQRNMSGPVALLFHAGLVNTPSTARKFEM